MCHFKIVALRNAEEGAGSKRRSEKIVLLLRPGTLKAAVRKNIANNSFFTGVSQVDYTTAFHRSGIDSRHKNEI